MRFTDPAAPLFIDVEGDLTEVLFVVATSQAIAILPRAQSRAHETPQRGMKREREQDGGYPRSGPWADSAVPTSARKVKPMKAAVRTSMAREMQNAGASASRAASVRESMPPPPSYNPGRGMSMSMPPPATPSRSQSHSQLEPPSQAQPQSQGPSQGREPLFLPSSQVSIAHLSQQAEEAIRGSGLGIENMDADEFLDMLEGEGEEVDFVPTSQAQEMELDVSMTAEDIFGRSSAPESEPEVEAEADSFDIYVDDEETQFGPTQGSSVHAPSSSMVSKTGACYNEKSMCELMIQQGFRPLFDD